MMTINLHGAKSVALVTYLLSHEYDIANEVNDFGDLKGIFLDVFNREPGSER